MPAARRANGQGEHDAVHRRAGFTGNGMPQAFLAGKAVEELVVGRDPATFVEAFRPSSRPLGPLGGDARKALRKAE